MTYRHPPNVLEDPLPKVILRLTIPTVLANITIVAYHLTDTYYISQLGVNDLASISFTFPIVMVIGSIIGTISLGVSTKVSQALGAQLTEKASYLAINGIILSLIVGFLLTFLGFYTSNISIKALGADQSIIPALTDYLHIYYYGILLLFLPSVFESIIRATGNSIIPSTISLLSVVINLVLDPFFILGFGGFPAFGLNGAAYTTLIASCFKIFAYLVLFNRFPEINLQTKHALQSFWKSVKEIFYISLPNLLAYFSYPLATTFSILIVSQFGKEVVAAFGVTHTLGALPMLVLHALSSTLVVVIGQNFGAKKTDRVQSAVAIGFRVSLIWGILFYIPALVFAIKIAEFFTDNGTCASVIILFIWITGLSYSIRGISIIASSIFNGIDKPVEATAITIVYLFLFYIPCLSIGAKIHGIIGALSGVALANILIGITSLWMTHHILKYR